MLHVRVDIIPGGVEQGRFTVADVYVGNDGTGDRDIGHYDVYTEDPRGQDYPRDSRRGWHGRVENFPRRWGYDALASAALDLLRERKSEAA